MPSLVDWTARPGEQWYATTQPTNTLEASKSAQFHYFPQLPVELQLRVWEFWRADEPVIRHYMCLWSPWGRPEISSLPVRMYAAFNTKTQSLVQTCPDEAYAPLDPFAYRIQLPYTSMIRTIVTDPGLKGYEVLREIFQPRYQLGFPPRTVITSLQPAITWVNFERDVFVIDNEDYRLPGRLRYILRGIGAKVPRVLETNHWATQIRFLAFDNTYNTDFNVDTRNDLDGKVLAEMKSLRTIFLVYRTSYRCPFTRQAKPDGDHGFKDAVAFIQEHESMPHGRQWWSEMCYDGLNVDKARKWVAQIRRLLDGVGKEAVGVNAVVDLI